MKCKVSFTCLIIVLVLSATGIARADQVSVAKHFGVGIHVNMLNLGIGPCVEYWATENLGVMGTVGAMFDFASVGVRGNYLLNETFEIAGYPARPYIGAGFASVKGPDYGDIEQNGSGIEVYGGLLQNASYLMENLYFRGELIFSTIKLETSGKTPYGETATLENDWGLFSLGAGFIYYF